MTRHSEPFGGFNVCGTVVDKEALLGFKGKGVEKYAVNFFIGLYGVSICGNQKSVEKFQSGHTLFEIIEPARTI